MAKTYLSVTFKDKDAAKALGARWDGELRQWFVPEGRELAPFAVWLPPGALSTLAPNAALPSSELTPFAAAGTELALPSNKGVSLSQLLAGVGQAVASAYRAGVWTLVEVVELRANNGHVYLGVSERDVQGAVLAKTTAVIWQSTANVILAEFERATGAQLAAGIKLLVRARPVFKSVYGFNLEIDAIDSEYTLGDLEARKREIRTRLQTEGVFALNKQLLAPWDFNAVLVIAPENAAGLGDFQRDADLLAQGGVCRFTYAHSRFQGAGAAKEIGDALVSALKIWAADGALTPDAIVIIRGGGAVNDLAWLNDYDLARLICDLPIPVITGIGHERDSTVIDEVAHTSFDTPSKVIAGIEQVIAKRAAEAKANYESIVMVAARAAQATLTRVVEIDVTLRSETQRHLTQAKQSSLAYVSSIRLDAMKTVRLASEQSREDFLQVKAAAVTDLATTKREVPALWDQIGVGVKQVLRAAATESVFLRDGVLDRAKQDVEGAKQAADGALNLFCSVARSVVTQSNTTTQALMREITGQGPQKTLSRGFAIVRTPAGAPLTRAAQIDSGAAIEIQFSDGQISAVSEQKI